MPCEYEQTWAEWYRDDSEPPDIERPKGEGWRLVGVVSPWRGHIVWTWEREVKPEEVDQLVAENNAWMAEE